MKRLIRRPLQSLFARIIIGFSCIVATSFWLNSCKETSVGSDPFQNFEIDGLIWGYGPALIRPLDSPGYLLIERTSVQGVDTAGGGFRIFAAERAQPLPSTRKSPLYADWHPEKKILAIFRHKIEFVARTRQPGVIDIYFHLNTAGASLPGTKKLHIGAAAFARTTLITEVRLAEGLKLSRLARGSTDDLGSWVLHLPELDELNSIDAEDKGEISFTSQTISSSPSVNALLCQERFYALARTNEQRVNHGCSITIAPSPEPVDGMLSCTIRVSIASVNAPGEETCIVTGYFVGDEGTEDPHEGILLTRGKELD